MLLTAGRVLTRQISATNAGNNFVYPPPGDEDLVLHTKKTTGTFPGSADVWADSNLFFCKLFRNSLIQAAELFHLHEIVKVCLFFKRLIKSDLYVRVSEASNPQCTWMSNVFLSAIFIIDILYNGSQRSWNPEVLWLLQQHNFKAHSNL